MPEGVYGIGVKGPDPALTRDRLPRIQAMSDHWADDTTVDLGPIRMTTRQLWDFTRHYTTLAARRRVHRWLGRPAPADTWAKPTS